MKAAWFPPKKPASESSNGFQSPLPRRRVSRIGRNFRVVEGKTSRNKPAISDGLFDHIEFLQAFPHIGAPIKGHPHVRRLLHSPLYVYYRLDENRGAFEILHFWHSSQRDPKFSTLPSPPVTPDAS